MRIKQLLAHFPKIQLLWERTVFSKLTIFYFVFSVLHCFIQIIFQVQAFFINADASSFLSSIIQQGNATAPGFPVFGEDLRWCETVPSSIDASSCQVIWSPRPSAPTPSATATQQEELNTVAAVTNVLTTTVASSSAPTSSAVAKALVTSASRPLHSTVVRLAATSTKGSAAVTRSVVQQSPSATKASGAVASSAGVSQAPASSAVQAPAANYKIDAATGLQNHHRRLSLGQAFGQIEAVNINGTTQVQVDGLGNNNDPVTLNRTCLYALNWPVVQLSNTKREDVTFIAFQIWVLGMSIVALLNESIPHVIASLLTHALATAWSGFAIKNTADFHAMFTRLTVNGACNRQLLPTYWQARANAEIPSCALNAVAFLVSCFLSWRLIKLFGWQTFKRVGASFQINRIYKIVLSLTIVIQLSLFFIVASLGLWLDQLWNGSVGQLSTRPNLYKGIIIAVFILLIPWLATGWFAVRRELNIPMLIFIALSLLYIVGWGGMFASTTFRWTFVQWRFFSLITSASVLLTLMTFGLGIVCRRNFYEGLTRYLNAEEPLGDDEPRNDKYGGDLEKVAFPSSNRPVPTFSVAFGSGNEVPPPSQMRFAPRQMGPRFSNPSTDPFDAQPDLGLPNPAHMRLDSNGSSFRGTNLTRSDSRSSEKSYSSTSSGKSAKRWIIE